MLQPERDIRLAPHTYYKIGGVAREVYFPSSTSEMLELAQELQAGNTPYFLLGGASNVLVGDGYWDGAVIITTALNSATPHSGFLACDAGLASSRAAEIALEQEKTGLEFLYLLPGTIGGALAGNVRYDNRSLSSILVSTLAVHPKRGIKRFKKSDLVFGYKYTSIIEEGWIVCEVELAWRYGNSKAIQAAMDRIDRFRTDNHHFDYPSCGCIFKNDHEANVQAGRLIDSLGLKGMSVGDARISPHHANFIINTGNATARDVLALIEQIETTVREQTGITLAREIRLAGAFD